MKKIVILVILISFVLVASCFAIEANYRISSGEVLAIGDNLRAQDIYHAVVVDPVLTDGTATRGPVSNEYRELGYAKIYTGSEVRNATQEEIDGFQAFRDDDNNKKIAAKAVALMVDDPRFRKIIAALIKGIIKEDNENRETLNAILDSIANATSLANFQSLAGAVERPTDREFDDAKTYIINQISKDD